MDKKLTDSMGLCKYCGTITYNYAKMCGTCKVKLGLIRKMQKMIRNAIRW